MFPSSFLLFPTFYFGVHQAGQSAQDQAKCKSEFAEQALSADGGSNALVRIDASLCVCVCVTHNTLSDIASALVNMYT